MKQLTPQQLHQRLDAATPVLLDVREGWEYGTAHIAGAVHIPMGEIPYRHSELDPSAEIVVICHHGMRSAQVTQYLTQLGFDDVHNLSGGIDAWSREVDPSVPRY